MKRVKKSENSAAAGFTLVEVMISMVLLAIVLSGAFSTYILGIRMMSDFREEVRATQIIQSEIERLRTQNFTKLGTYLGEEEFTPKGEFIDQYTDMYTAHRTVSSISSGKQYLVSIKVEWTSQGGRDQARYFNTVFTKDGLNDYYYRDL